MPRPYIPPSATDNWATPQDLFDRLNHEFGFTVDVAADSQNAKCSRFFSAAQDGLAQDWSGETVWCNPPYGRVIAEWMKKAYESAQQGATVVLLVPARTDTGWYHDYAMQGEVRFLRGRVKFGGSPNAAPFPSIVVVFRPPVAIARRAA